MTGPAIQAVRESVHYVDTVDGFVPVSVAGHENGRAAVMFDENQHNPDAYGAVREHRKFVGPVR